MLATYQESVASYANNPVRTLQPRAEENITKSVLLFREMCIWYVVIYPDETLTSLLVYYQFTISI
jgi:hypothetical protein